MKARPTLSTFLESTTHTTLSSSRSPISSLDQKLLAIGAGVSGVLLSPAPSSLAQLTRISQSRQLNHDPVNLLPLRRDHILDGRDTQVLDTAAQTPVGQGEHVGRGRVGVVGVGELERLGCCQQSPFRQTDQKEEWGE